MKNFLTKKLVLNALFIALGLVLPFLTGQIPRFGNMLLPMHIPVLLCGLICGWSAGLAVGFIIPILRSIVFGMPMLFPFAITMAFELAAYGCIAGWVYTLLSKKNFGIYVALVIAMIGGRIVWGIMSYLIYGLSTTAFTWDIFIAGAFVNALPGIVIQLVLIPMVIIALKPTKLIEYAR